MTCEEDLPVWAKVLLGLPVTDKAVNDFNRTGQPADNGQQAATSLERPEQQSVLVLERAAVKRTWRNLMCPAPGKFRS